MSTLNKILLTLNLFFLQAYLIRFQIHNYPTNLQEVLIVLQLFTFIYVTPFKQILPAIGKHWIIMSFLGLTTLSVLLVPIENRLDFVRHFKFLIFASILTFIFLETLKTDTERKAGLRIAGIGAILFGIFSIFYNLAGYNVALDHRLLGPLDAAVYLAYYLTPFFIYFALEFIENPKQKSNLLYSILLALLIIATQSMGSITTSVIVILIYLFKRSNLKILKSKVTKSIMAIAFIAALAVTIYTKIIPSFQTRYSSLNERDEIWKTSIALLKDPYNLAFGIGYGQFQQKYFNNVEQAIGQKPLDFYVLQPHNEFLLFIFQYGLLGLFLIIFCIYKICQNIYRLEKKPNLAQLASFIALYFFLHGLIDTPWFKNDTLILLVLFLELSCCYFKPLTKSNKTA